MIFFFFVLFLKLALKAYPNCVGWNTYVYIFLHLPKYYCKLHQLLTEKGTPNSLNFPSSSLNVPCPQVVVVLIPWAGRALGPMGGLLPPHLRGSLRAAALGTLGGSRGLPWRDPQYQHLPLQVSSLPTCYDICFRAALGASSMQSSSLYGLMHLLLCRSTALVPG